MTDLNTSLENLFLTEHEIYKFLKIDAYYLTTYHTDKRTEGMPYDPTLEETVGRLKKFLHKWILTEGFKTDKLLSLKIKTFINLANNLFALDMKGVDSMNMDSRKVVYFDNWLNTCESKLKLIEAQKNYITQYLD